MKNFKRMSAIFLVVASAIGITACGEIRDADGDCRFNCTSMPADSS